MTVWRGYPLMLGSLGVCAVAAQAEPPTELEEIVVEAERPAARHFRQTGAIDFVFPDEQAVPPATTLELIKEVPGVAENGQGGHFQNYSVRGMSRHRVMTQVDGVRIVTERRAGASASFLDPLLLDDAEVQRGALTTFYGNGALGGLVRLQSRWFDGTTLETGYSTNGNQQHQVAGTGGEHWSLGISRRKSENTETADGDELNSHFTQYSSAIRGKWQNGSERYQVSMISALAEDVGKPNIDYPERITRYPSEEHLIVNVQVDSSNGWGARLFGHPNSLETEVRENATERTEVEDKSTDFGGSIYLTAPLGVFEASFGLDYVGRRDVNTEEKAFDLSGLVDTRRTLYGGREDEWGLFASVQHDLSPSTSIELAGRAIILNQQNGRQGDHADDNALTGHVGVTQRLLPGLNLMANLSHGVRFPTLSERYYAGTTGRGTVIGNPELDAETSNSLDLGLSWEGPSWSTEVWTFYSQIDDIIERIEVTEDVLTYQNLTSGHISGIEASFNKDLAPNWSVRLQAQWQEGESDENEPLADVPANRARLHITYDNDPWLGRLTLEQRASKNDPGSGEQSIESATLLSARLEYRLSDRFSLGLFGSNLLNQEYYNTADRKANAAEGLSLGLDLRLTL